MKIGVWRNVDQVMADPIGSGRVQPRPTVEQVFTFNAPAEWTRELSGYRKVGPRIALEWTALLAQRTIWMLSADRSPAALDVAELEVVERFRAHTRWQPTVLDIVTFGSTWLGAKANPDLVLAVGASWENTGPAWVSYELTWDTIPVPKIRKNQ